MPSASAPSRLALRHLGPYLALLLILVAAASRWSAHGQASEMLEREARALSTFASLGRASLAAIQQGPHPGLGALLAAHPGLSMLDVTDDSGSEFAADNDYVFGLARSRNRDSNSTWVDGFVLRAWPVRFGETGDGEFHLDETGRFYRGQNDLGRSGIQWGFPPPFPQPGLATGLRATWWATPLPDAVHR